MTYWTGRGVQSPRVADPRHRLGGGALSEVRRRGVAREEVDQEEGGRRHPEEDGDQREEAVEDEPGHAPGRGGAALAPRPPRSPSAAPSGPRPSPCTRRRRAGGPAPRRSSA